MIDLYTVGFGKQKEFTLDIVGGKARGLLEMNSLGVNVPPAVVVPTNYCNSVNNKEVSVMEISMSVMTELENIEKMFGYMPLFSVRSGAKVSLPGMLSTILNVGLCATTIPTWVSRIGERATWDSYRRLIQMFGDVVFNIPSQQYEDILSEFRQSDNVTTDSELSVSALKVIATKFLEITPEFPQSFKMQLRKAIAAVFSSWNNERAIAYRNIHKYSHDMGTAVIIQTMVFGNLNDNSCTGVLFTRNPSTGESKIHGEYLVNAQGEDVVAGIRTPLPLEQMSDWNSEILSELVTTVNKLEVTAKDMQDVEFTVQNGKLFILQTRNAKRTAIAAVKIAADLVVENIITKEDAFKRVSYEQYIKAQSPILDSSLVPPTAIGIPASSGFATGVVAFSSEKAVELAKTKAVILLSKETTPEDIKGIHASLGILTQLGGSSSHAAVVARGMDKVCVVGCLDLQSTVVNIDGTIKAWTVNNVAIEEGVTQITIEGGTGKVWVNKEIPIIGAINNPAVTLFNSWIKSIVNFTEVVTSGNEGYLLTHNFDNDTEGLKKVVKDFKGIISLDTSKTSINEWDSYLFELVNPFDEATIKLNKLTALMGVPVENVFIDIEDLKLGVSDTKVFLKQGYNFIKTIDSLEDVILNKGRFKYAKDFKITKAVSEVLNLKAQVGQIIKPIVFVDTFDVTKEYSNCEVVATKEIILKSLFN